MVDEFNASGTGIGESVYKGGTKQPDNCPTLITKSGTPNKDDIKRVYLSTKRAPVTENNVTTDHVFLNLAFVRSGPLNSTSSSTHIAFEFNQNSAPCPGNNHTDPVGRSLVSRSTAKGGDLLIQYDYEGGGDPP